ncbi:hypothetical protein OG806_24010 [Streptomyces sp. NBC_00882]|uniref:hypothetical protein n=1 Tax=Streptomyces sp. NBC_00882 TaxID=2975856 RepID=UPI00386F6EE0|nr:hypothetical protein OG806_24010 [Streptomyces sp. NBC_00882]
MAHFWINRDVPGAQEHQVHADSYEANNEYIHFYSDAGHKVMSIRKDITFLVERSDG